MIIFKKLRLEDRVYSNTTGRIYTVYEISCDRVMIQADDDGGSYVLTPEYAHEFTKVEVDEEHHDVFRFITYLFRDVEAVLIDPNGMELSEAGSVWSKNFKIIKDGTAAFQLFRFKDRPDLPSFRRSLTVSKIEKDWDCAVSPLVFDLYRETR